jgi:hypothetical protein
MPLGTRHVVGGPGVADPDLGLPLLLRPESDEHLLFMQVYHLSSSLDDACLHVDRNLNPAIRHILYLLSSHRPPVLMLGTKPDHRKGLLLPMGKLEPVLTLILTESCGPV